MSWPLVRSIPVSLGVAVYGAAVFVLIGAPPEALSASALGAAVLSARAADEERRERRGERRRRGVRVE